MNCVIFPLTSITYPIKCFAKNLQSVPEYITEHSMPIRWKMRLLGSGFLLIGLLFYVMKCTIFWYFMICAIVFLWISIFCMDDINKLEILIAYAKAHQEELMVLINQMIDDGIAFVRT